MINKKELKILCWNVNGIRAVAKRGFLDWLKQEAPDILCLQETKAHPENLPPDLLQPAGYFASWHHAVRKGYSGVATFSRTQPLAERRGFGIPGFDSEGRVIISEYPGFSLYNVYFPNGKMSEARLRYKLDFYDAFLEHIEVRRRKGEKLIICGDYNTAHREIDLARPKENEKVSGFLPVERAWLDRLVARGYIDTFRHFDQRPGQYTWWDMKSRARERNVGWRIDYFFVTGNLLPQVVKACILPEVTGSDHCPIGLVVKVP